MRITLFLAAWVLGCGTASPTTAEDDTGTVAVEDSGTTSTTDTSTAPTEDSALDTQTTDTAVDTNAPEAPATYPAGPYGKNVGNVLADLALEGYVRFETTGLATAATNGPTSFADLRAKSPRKHALIHVSGFT